MRHPVTAGLDATDALASWSSDPPGRRVLLVATVDLAAATARLGSATIEPLEAHLLSEATDAAGADGRVARLGPGRVAIDLPFPDDPTDLPVIATALGRRLGRAVAVEGGWTNPEGQVGSAVFERGDDMVGVLGRATESLDAVARR